MSGLKMSGKMVKSGTSHRALPGADVLVLLLLVLLHGGTTLVRADNLALLSGTLRTFQRTGCGDEMVTLKCPHGTSISIQIAQYAKNSPTRTLCPDTVITTTPAPSGILTASRNIIIATESSGEDKVGNSTQGAIEGCQWPDALQYSLLQTVVEACQKKRQCKFPTSPKAFGGDPCPGLRKFVEVAYKCRPYEFRSKVACENDVIHLKCNPNSRIAVYSASYGRTEYESIQCPQPQGVQEETCLMSYATETVMQICHGKRRCTLSADAATFGNPCRPQSRMYLKVVYTCVPRKVLKDRYDGPPEEDEPPMSESLDEDDHFYDEDQFFRESAAIPPAPNLLPGPGQNPAGGQSGNQFSSDGSGGDGLAVTTSRSPHARRKNVAQALRQLHVKRDDHFSKQKRHRQRLSTPQIKSGAVVRWPYNCPPRDDDSDGTDDVTTVNFVTQWMLTYAFLSQNLERFYLYVILAVAGGILLCLAMVITRLLISRRRKRLANSSAGGKSPSSTIDHTLPTGFADDTSDDIDLTTLNHQGMGPDQVLGSTMTDVAMPTGECAKPMMYHPSGGPQMTTIMAYGDTSQHLPQGAATIAYTQIPGVTYGPPGSLAVVHGGTLGRRQNMTMLPSVVPNLLHNAPPAHVSADVTLRSNPSNQHFYYG